MAPSSTLFALGVLVLGASGFVSQPQQQQRRDLRRQQTTKDDYATVVERSVRKPMGLLLEEVDGGLGAQVVQIDPEGNGRAEVLINDVILAVNAEIVSDYEFDDVMETIKRQPGDVVRLTLGRGDETWVEVRWPNGVGIAAAPGDSMAELADLCDNPVAYLCKDGACGTCEHKIRDPNGQERYTRICVAKVPSSAEREVIQVLPTDR